jgi:predicted amidohydrolase YtcJ
MSNVLIGNRNDWRFSIHSVGDAAIDWVLDAYEAADKDKSIVGRRFACMHCSLIRKDQLERMNRLGVILELQNAFMWDKADNVERNLGLAVANRAVPNRMAIDILGINNVSMGTDYQTNSMDPWINLYIAVTRKDPRGKVYGADQAITREEALRLYTVSGAYSSFEEKVKGPIEVGKLADMVVLDRDYFTIPAEQIKDVKPLQTIVGGAVVYRR